MKVRARAVSMSLLLSALASAQQPVEASAASDLRFGSLSNGLAYRCVHVAGSRGVCAVLAFRVGTDHDPAGQTGLAAAVAELMRLQQADALTSRRLQVTLRGPATLIATTRDGGQLRAALADLRATLSGELDISDDLAQRARGRAAYRADDDSMIYPGPMLRGLAERALLVDTPSGRQASGIPAELKALADGVVRDRCRDLLRPRNAVLVVLGGAPEADLQAAVESAFAGLPAGALAAPEPTVHDSLGAVEEETVHDRVAAPYVTLALCGPTPEDPGYVQFLVAMNVVRTRAARAFLRMEGGVLKLRGGEDRAQVLPFDLDGDSGARVALITRRARDGDDLDEPRDEITAFAAALCRPGPSPAEIERAKIAVAQRVELPPYSPAAVAAMVSPGALYARAVHLAMAEVLGWPRDLQERVRAVTDREVRGLLRDLLAPRQHRWFVLVPRD